MTCLLWLPNLVDAQHKDHDRSTDHMKDIDAFIKAYYTQTEELFLEFDAKEYGLTKENYWEKVLRPSDITAADFKPIEDMLGLTLPASFKLFYQSYFSLEKDFDTGGLFIAGNTENSDLAALKDYFFNTGISTEMTDLGLIPFGLYNDEWYVCLDMNSNPKNPQIVFFEGSNWGAGKAAISHRPWF